MQIIASMYQVEPWLVFVDWHKDCLKQLLNLAAYNYDSYLSTFEFIHLKYHNSVSRPSSTQCTNTNQGSTWYELMILCSYPTRLSELMSLMKLRLSLWQHIITRKSRSSKLTTIPLPKDSEIQEAESHKKSKKNLPTQ